MKSNHVFLISALVAAVLLLSSLIPVLAASPRYPNLQLAPIPSDSSSVQICSKPVESPALDDITPLLDGTGIFQDSLLEGITQAHPAVSPFAADSSSCTVTYSPYSG